MSDTSEAVARAEKVARASTGCTNEVAATFAREFLAALEAEGFVIMKRINTQSVALREALERYGHLCVDEGTRPTDPGAAAMRDQPL